VGDIDIVVRYSRRIEKLLKNLGAEGRGMHEMVSSLREKIPYDLQQSLRYIATIRNNLLHEDNFEIDDIDTFSDVCEKNISALEALLRPIPSKTLQKSHTNLSPNTGCLLVSSIALVIVLSLLVYIFIPFVPFNMEIIAEIRHLLK